MPAEVQTSSGQSKTPAHLSCQGDVCPASLPQRSTAPLPPTWNGFSNSGSARSDLLRVEAEQVSGMAGQLVQQLRAGLVAQRGQAPQDVAHMLGPEAGQALAYSHLQGLQQVPAHGESCVRMGNGGGVCRVGNRSGTLAEPEPLGNG